MRYKLSPSLEQEVLLRQFAGMCRLVQNLALEQRSTWARDYKIGYGQKTGHLTLLCAEFDFVHSVYLSCQQQALRDLDQSFATFFAARARYPTPRRKGVNDSFRFSAARLRPSA